MKNNDLTAKQDLIVREFWEVIAVNANDLMPNTPAFARQLRAICLLLMNYDVVGGHFIKKGQVITRPFGQKVDLNEFVCQWESDRELARAAMEINNSTLRVEASTSESTEDTEVGETVLREDVS